MSWNEDLYTGDVDDSRDFKLYSTPAGSNQPGAGVCVTNSTSSTVISQASQTFYLPTAGLTFAPTGDGSGGWSAPASDGSKATKSYDGDTYYPYTTTYSGSIPASNGTTCFPAFAFESQDENGDTYSSDYFFVDYSAVINGVTQGASAGPVSMDTAFDN